MDGPSLLAPETTSGRFSRVPRSSPEAIRAGEPVIARRGRDNVPLQPPPWNSDLPMNRSAIRDLFRALVNHPKLVWGASNTGCEAKADLMAEVAEEQGHEVSKIWIHPAAANSQFPVYLNRAKTESTYWNYHVAIVVRSESGAESDSEVIDPTLFPEPVNVAEWTRVLSLLANEYDQQLDVTKSPRNAFYGPDDMVTDAGRIKTLERREAILAGASNMDDPVIFTGCLMKLRGSFVDELMEMNPPEFLKLESFLLMSEFRRWFSSPMSHELMSELLNENPRYYGIDSAEILAKIDFEDVHASVDMKRQLWPKVGRAMRRLRDRAHDLTELGRSPEAHLFRSFWEDDMFRGRWFSPFCESQWRDFGLDPERLAHP